jgi:ATP-binding cassette, subfamily B, bacterial PglK
MKILNYYLPSFIILLLFSVLVIFLELFSLVTLASFASTVIGSDNFFNKLLGWNYNFALQEILIFLFIVFFLKNALIVFYNYLLSKTKSNLISKISTILYSFFINTNYAENIKKKPSDTIRKINEDVVPAIDYLFLILSLFKEIFILISLFFILLFSTSSYFIFIITLFTLVLIIFYRSLSFFLKKTSSQYMNSRSTIIKLLHQSFGSLKENFVYKNNKTLLKQFNKNILAIRKFHFYKNFIGSLPKVIFEIMAIIVVTIVVFFLISQSAEQKELLNIIALLVVVIARLIPAFNTITSSLAIIKIHQSFFEIINLDILRYEKQKKTDINFEDSLEIEFKNSLNFQKIYFKYPKSKKVIFNYSDFLIQPNKSIGIYGSSGSGKTTLVDLSLGLQKSKNLFINSKLINRNFHFKDNLIGYVPQFPFLLEDTISKNIIFNRERFGITKKDLNRALKIAKLYDFVQTLPKKENTLVGNSGSFLSGGQRQRIVIARAVLLRPQILILDEATNALDPETEREIIEDILDLKRKICIIMISHKTSNFKKCDNIYKIDNKKITKIK